MKKLLFSLFAVLTVLASCTSDDFDAVGGVQPKKFKFGFSVSSSKGDQSRALKGDWEDGDVVYYCFKGISDGALKMVYKNNEWKSYVVSNKFSDGEGGVLTGDELSAAMDEFAKEVANNTDKRYKAIWVRGQHELTWVGKEDRSEGYWSIGNRGCEYWESAEDNLEYFIKADEVDPEVGIIIPVSNYTWKMGAFTKISVYNLPEGHWTLYSPNMNPLMGQGIDPHALATTKESADVNGRYMPVSEEVDGGVAYGAFYGTPDGGANTILYLTNGTETWVKKYNKSLPAAVKISQGLAGFQKLEETLNGHGYVDLGLMRKDLDPTSSSTTRIMIGDRNLGAENITDYGLYFRWGELEGWNVTASTDVTNIFANYTVATAAQKVSPTGEVKTDAFSSTDTFVYGTSTVDDFTGKTNLTAGNGMVYGDAATNYWGAGWQMEPLLSELEEFNFKSDGDVLKVTLGAVNITCTRYNDYEGTGVAGFELKNDITWRKTFVPAAGFFVCNGKGITVDQSYSDSSSQMLFGLMNFGKRGIGASYWAGKSDNDNYGVASIFATVDFRGAGMNIYKTFAVSTARKYGYSYGPIYDGRIKLDMPKSCMLPIRAFTEIDM